jgi:hypothetical protein
MMGMLAAGTGGLRSALSAARFAVVSATALAFHDLDPVIA